MRSLIRSMVATFVIALSFHSLFACNLVGPATGKNKNISDSAKDSEALKITLNLSMGLVADYGATPWRTSDIKFGDSQMNVALDTGTNLLWATVSDCETDACKVHRGIDTSQADFRYISDATYPKTVDFGAWGKMTVKLGSIPVSVGTGNPTSVPLRFDASVDYSGSQFQYLAWGGWDRISFGYIV